MKADIICCYCISAWQDHGVCEVGVFMRGLSQLSKIYPPPSLRSCLNLSLWAYFREIMVELYICHNSYMYSATKPPKVCVLGSLVPLDLWTSGPVFIGVSLSEPHTIQSLMFSEKLTRWPLHYLTQRRWIYWMRQRTPHRVTQRRWIYWDRLRIER